MGDSRVAQTEPNPARWWVSFGRGGMDIFSKAQTARAGNERAQYSCRVQHRPWGSHRQAAGCSILLADLLLNRGRHVAGPVILYW